MATRKKPKERTGTPLENRNFLSPTGFKFSLKRSPGAAFFCNQANIPSLDLGTAVQPSYLKDIDVPGDKIQFGDLSIRFLVDEDLQNYQEIQNWMRGLGFPESLQEIYDLQNQTVGTTKLLGQNSTMNIYSDGTLTVLDAMQNDNFKVKFSDLFPFSLSTIQFDATMADTEYFTAEVSFKYLNYTIVKGSGFV